MARELSTEQRLFFTSVLKDQIKGMFTRTDSISEVAGVVLDAWLEAGGSYHDIEVVIARRRGET